MRSRGREERILLEARLEEEEEARQGEQERARLRETELEERLGRREERRGLEGDGEDRLERLENCLAEVEEEKGALQLKLVDLEDLLGRGGSSAGHINGN